MRGRVAFSGDFWRRGPRNSPPSLRGSASPPRGSLTPPGGELRGGSAETLPPCLGGAELLPPRLRGALGRMRALQPRAPGRSLGGWQLEVLIGEFQSRRSWQIQGPAPSTRPRKCLPTG